MKRIIIAGVLIAAIAGVWLLTSINRNPVFADTRTEGVISDSAAGGAIVTISNFKFGPKVVRIKAGSEVTWEVQEGTHTISADNGSFESPGLSAGQKFSHTFEKPGTFRYYCTLHGAKGGHDMAGTVIVTK